MNHVTCDITVALRVSVPLLPDGSWPSPDEVRECVIAVLRGFAFDDASGVECEIIDAAPSKRHLPE